MEEQKNYTTIWEEVQAARRERDDKTIEEIRRYISLLDRGLIAPCEAINLIKEIAK